MGRLIVGTENNAGIELYYEDHGAGQPVVLVPGYPLDGRSWERQELVLLEAGFRVVTYDRRGFGRSDRPAIGYDYDTLAADLHALLERLELENAVLVGFSMGTGEIVRYLGTYGSARVAKAVLIGSLPPCLLRSDENAQGFDGERFDEIRTAITDDRYAYLEDLLNDFYNVDLLGGTRISDQAWQAAFILAADASPLAMLGCVDSWSTDFRNDLRTIDVPVLALHGADDRILPIQATAHRLGTVLDDLRLVTVEGGPHSITWTHADEVNRALLAFLT
ncbi:alpha/beta fold hydrolase [Kribbella sp. NPDC058693]|uniref:alpha/beta fold hydrolase n=1 Tax=Kribbella sp. NPDC058693 TaxID=3346602 RepID=UPI0036615CFF